LGPRLASEGAVTLLDWEFSHAGYENVVACTMTVNYGSRRVMEKVGMTYTKTVFIDAGELLGGQHGEVWLR
jgi:RimJ/RimL family protein N-acetyltransferase